MSVFALSARKKSFYSQHKTGIKAALLLAIPIGWWLVLGAFPILFGLSLGFMEWKSLILPPKWAGFDNYITFFTSKYYYMPLIRSFLIGNMCFLSTTFLALFVAVMLNKLVRFKALLRAVWYVPCVTSVVVTTQIFNIFLDPADGVINNILINSGKEPIMWNLSVGWGLFWIGIYSVWKNIGGSILLWLAALQSVDRSICEAAYVDGAGKTRTFWQIIVPAMRPMIIYIFITGFVSAMQIYEQVLFITGGGPFGKTEVLAQTIMKDAFWDNNFGMAGASSMIMLLVAFGFTLFIFNKQSKDV